jgi:hypothetical protein
MAQSHSMASHAQMAVSMMLSYGSVLRGISQWRIEQAIALEAKGWLEGALSFRRHGRLVLTRFKAADCEHAKVLFSV